MQLVDQVNIIAAIKQAGNIKVISLSTIVWAIHHTKKDHLFPTPVNKRHVLTSLRFKKLWPYKGKESNTSIKVNGSEYIN